MKNITCNGDLFTDEFGFDYRNKTNNEILSCYKIMKKKMYQWLLYRNNNDHFMDYSLIPYSNDQRTT